MAFKLNDAPIQHATVRVPAYGAWTATVAVAGPLVLAEGARATLIVGDLTLIGTVSAGGTYAEQATYQIVGGNAKWSALVLAFTHRSDLGVTVAEAAAALCSAAGELGVVLEAGAERPLGYAWLRRGGLASDALAELVGSSWWVAVDGVTHLGPRPSTSIQPANVNVLAYEVALRRATVALTDDALAQLQPGVAVTLPGLPAPLQIGGVTIRVEAEAVTVDLLGERPVSELLSALLAARRGAATPQLYQVTDDAQGRTSARPAGPSSPVLPDEVWIDHAPGVPGMTAQLAPGAMVLVAFLDGSPGAPRVVGYLPGALPLALALDAVNGVQIGKGASGITLGGAAAVKAARSDLTDQNLAALWSAINSLRSAAGQPPLPGMLTVAADKVSIE